jgi:hypothetical protein
MMSNCGVKALVNPCLECCKVKVCGCSSHPVEVVLGNKVFMY